MSGCLQKSAIKVVYIMSVVEVAAIVGAITGTLALVGRVRDRFMSYLHIALEVEAVNGAYVSAKTIVENKSLKRKNLSNAIILVGPEEESPIETMRLLGKSIKITNQIIQEVYTKTIIGPDGRCLISPTLLLQ